MNPVLENLYTFHGFDGMTGENNHPFSGIECQVIKDYGAENEMGHDCLTVVRLAEFQRVMEKRWPTHNDCAAGYNDGWDIAIPDGYVAMPANISQELRQVVDATPFLNMEEK